jgi:hypothetical protein
MPAGESIGAAAESATRQPATLPDDADIAVQKSDKETDEEVPVARRIHGTALPR